MQQYRCAKLVVVPMQKNCSIYVAEGVRGFREGRMAAYARTGPQTLIIFTVSEIMRPLFGLAAIGGSS
jgi:hypothetical protein